MKKTLIIKLAFMVFVPIFSKDLRGSGQEPSVVDYSKIETEDKVEKIQTPSEKKLEFIILCKEDPNFKNFSITEPKKHREGSLVGWILTIKFIGVSGQSKSFDVFELDREKIFRIYKKYAKRLGLVDLEVPKKPQLQNNPFLITGPISKPINLNIDNFKVDKKSYFPWKIFVAGAIIIFGAVSGWFVARKFSRQEPPEDKSLPAVPPHCHPPCEEIVMPLEVVVPVAGPCVSDQLPPVVRTPSAGLALSLAGRNQSAQSIAGSATPVVFHSVAPTCATVLPAVASGGLSPSFYVDPDITEESNQLMRERIADQRRLIIEQRRLAHNAALIANRARLAEQRAHIAALSASARAPMPESPVSYQPSGGTVEAVGLDESSAAFSPPLSDSTDYRGSSSGFLRVRPRTRPRAATSGLSRPQIPQIERVTTGAGFDASAAIMPGVAEGDKD